MWYILVVLGIPTSSILHVGTIETCKKLRVKSEIYVYNKTYMSCNCSETLLHPCNMKIWPLIDLWSNSSQMISTRLILGTYMKLILISSQPNKVNYGFQGFYVGWMRGTLVLKIPSHLISMVESAGFIVEGWWVAVGLTIGKIQVSYIWLDPLSIHLWVQKVNPLQSYQ